MIAIREMDYLRYVFFRFNETIDLDLSLIFNDPIDNNLNANEMVDSSG